MNSKILYQFCIANYTESVLEMFKHDKDIDILYREGIIIRSMIIDKNAELLQAAINYFENTQFPIKDAAYEEASRKLMEILEESADNEDAPPEIRAIIAKYTGDDVACLDDVDEARSEDESVDETTTNESPEESSNSGSSGVTMSAVVLKSNHIEDCIVAARTGNNIEVLQHLDMTNRSLKILILREAIQYEHESVIDALVGMADTDHKKATILRAAGDLYTKSYLFQKAEEYYNKSMEMHADYYVTYHKLGKLYDLWSLDDSAETDPETPKQQAFDNYHKAYIGKPTHIQYDEILRRIEALRAELAPGEQLKLSSMDKQAEDSSSTSEEEEELLDDDEIELMINLKSSFHPSSTEEPNTHLDLTGQTPDFPLPDHM